MKRLDIVILLYDSFYGRSYLSALKYAGYSPKKIIHVKIKKNILNYISDNPKVQLFKNILFKSIYFARARVKKRKLIKYINEVCNKDGEQVDYYGKINLEDYSDNVDVINVKSINDKELEKKISNENSKVFMFTGGGILESNMLDLPNKKYIHIHPGIVPAIKGSDGLLWSYLIDNKIGFSCFYMNKNIDEGDVIKTKRYKMPELVIKSDYKDYDLLYKSILMCIDAKYRSKLLIEVMDENNGVNDLSHLPTISQKKSDGRYYFTMHERLRNQVIKRMIKRA